MTKCMICLFGRWRLKLKRVSVPYFIDVSLPGLSQGAGLEMKCGFCGTHVPDNYTVCTGCHAVYRLEPASTGCRPALPMLTGIIILFYTPAISELGLRRPFIAAAIFITGLVLFIRGLRRLRRLRRLQKVTPRVGRWYRKRI
jgi:hypothetical protein